MEPMKTAELADHLGVTYRQLDYLARTTTPDGRDLANADGSGSRRLWDRAVVRRLEIAAMLANVSGRAWSSMAAAVLAAPEPPVSGWAFLDDLGDVHYATDVDRLAHVVAKGDGGIVARYALTDSTPTTS